MKYTALSFSLLVLAACGGGDTHGTSTDPNAATGFITANDYVPSSADDSRDDGIPRDADGRPFTYVHLGQPLPAFSGETVGGGRYASSNIDQWTIIDVWGIWCGDCMADAPYVSEVASRAALDDGLDFISIHTPPNAARADEAYGKFGSVEAYFNAKGYSYPTVLDIDASIRDALGIGWTPSYLLVSPDGIVRGYRTDLSVAGDTPVDDFLADIAKVRAKHAGIQRPIRKASIGPDGTGGISGMTPFTYQAVEAAFPGSRVVPGEAIAEGDPYPVFKVFADADPDAPLFTVWPNWDRGHVGFVVTGHEAVNGPDGALIGKTLHGELAADQRSKCHGGADDYGNALICTIGNDRQFQYIFTASRVDAGTDLASAAPNIKARAVLTELRYLPPTPETN